MLAIPKTWAHGLQLQRFVATVPIEVAMRNALRAR
jgi:hypothetical protein